MFKAFTSALFRKDKSFTLIELMVVMTIISIMTAVVLANYRAGGQQLALDRSANKLAQDIRRAQEMAMSSRKEGGCGPGFSGEYGIRLSRLDAQYPGPKYYALFANCGDDIDEKGEYDLETDIRMYEMEFESEVRFYKIQYYQGGVNPWVPMGLGAEKVNILFSPPDPERTIYTDDPSVNNAVSGRQRLVLSMNGKFKCVYVNKAGLIYIDECYDL